MSSKILLFILVITAVTLTACRPVSQQPIPIKDSDTLTSSQLEPSLTNPTEHNLDKAIEAINALEELGVE